MTPGQFRQELDSRGLSLSQAAEVLNMSRRMVIYLRSGESEITGTREDSIRLRLGQYDQRPR